MLTRSKSPVLSSRVISLVLFSALLSCSSRAGLRASDIDRSQDSVVLGRVSFRPGSGCSKLLKLPYFELRSIAERKCIPYHLPDLTISEKDQRIELPVAQKVDPGTYDLRIAVVEESWDPLWLDAGMLTLVRFEVPKGFLVYFGTVEIDVKCEQFQRHGEARYVEHDVRDEFEFELNLFQNEHREVYQMYQNRTIRQVSDVPWKNL